MNGYIAFYKGQRKEVYADTLFAAQQEATKQFQQGLRRKIKPGEVTVALAELDGKPYVHTAVD